MIIFTNSQLENILSKNVLSKSYVFFHETHVKAAIKGYLC